ncbi:MAG TPA: ABC transporter ATP-binding protein [Armatimonadota bacterium]|jgi:ATP-binding cassette subfamily B protein
MSEAGGKSMDQLVRGSGPSLYARMLAMTRGYRVAILGVLLLELLSTPLALLAPVPLQVAVDSVLQGRPIPHYLRGVLPSPDRGIETLLLAVCALSVLLVLLSQLQSLASNLLTTYTGQNLILALRTRLFRQAQRLSANHHSTLGTADAIYRVQTDATAVEWIFIDGFIPLVNAAFALISMLYVILRLDVKIGSVALAVSPVLFLLTRISRPVLRRQSREVKRMESVALGFVQETLSILRVVKAFGQEAREERRYVDQVARCIRGRLRVTLVEGVLGLSINLVLAVGTGLVLYIGVGNVLAKTMSLGQLLLTLSYVAQLYSPLKTLSRKCVSMQSQFASMERVFAFLDLPPDVPERPDARPLHRAEGALSFQDVSFCYEPNRPILKHISFEVEPGTRAGIVGSTGAGKTTLTNLMVRFADPTEGQVLLDGVDLRDLRLADARSQFSIVFQEPVLFATSLAENIAYGCPGASREQIEEAARAADIHEQILRLPDAYATLVGERGLKLSGGERQRIGLARAFLRDAPFLILDEPTSSVDLQTEATILEAMERLMRGRTTFIIAHRLNTLVHCDLLLHLEDGWLMEVTRTSHQCDSALARLQEEMAGPQGA